MNQDELKMLRDLPIEGVAERLGLRVTHHKALCPFHNDHHASLSFNLRRNTYRCFVCGISGNGIDLVMNHLHLDFPEACRWLASGTHIILESDLARQQASAPKEQKPFDASRYEPYFQRPWLSDAAQQFLFEERRLDPRVVRWCRLTSWRDNRGIDWLQTPYFSADGRLIGIQNRRLTPAEGVPRFRFPQGARCSIYNLPVLQRLRPGDELWITEGASDCWAMLSAGRKAIAIPSATLLSPRDKQFLHSLATQGSPDLRFSMAPDNDVPGQQLYLSLREILPNLHHHPLPQDCKDFSDYYLRHIFSKDFLEDFL